MQHVIFARDRRRKKHRLKVFIFLLAILSVFIGIMLAIQSQNRQTADRNAIPTVRHEQQTMTEPSSQTSDQTENVQITSSRQSETETKQTDGEQVAAETSQVLSAITEAESAPKSGEQTAIPPIALELNDVAQSIVHEELTYIDIDPNDVESQYSGDMAEDPNATSYEDELTDKDDEVEVADSTAVAEGLSQEAENVLEDFLDIADQAIRIQNQFSYTVTRGDKLKDVLEQSGLGPATAKALEKKFPQLTGLQPGQQFYWILDKEGELEYMNWLISEKEEKIFERKEKNQFSVQTIQKKGIWKQDVIKGTLSGDFSASLKAVGLSQRQINQLASGLQWQIATNKLKKGDKFAILVKREYINGKVTDLGNVEAIHIISSRKSYYAIQAENGRYYSRHGETLGKGFARYPLQFTPRTSSPFNPRRLHPVTRRVAPHKGVDFAIPTGTPIIAPADGVVEHIAYQANGAGRYIKLRHGSQYTTVYMHLSRALVRVGQTVKKGERIALSGNTGRSTGPHLHYEFHINGHPVNPMTVKLPGTGSGMPDKERKAFLMKARYVETKLKI
ncbi:murein DD-endopeptidase MepM [Glaesserella sp.]|uniref:murein DD-endopeptidase MepM n=1 Tax=Glaesserella sp. TaxID=2094731 RepID=UPI00359F574D